MLAVVLARDARCFIPTRSARCAATSSPSLFYVTNWYLIFAHQSYFAQFAAGRRCLQHLWSLAVEEQFYLLWPLILAAACCWFGKRRLALPACSSALAALDGRCVAVLYSAGHDPSRVYYGTDTRAAALLVGAALAFVWPPWRLRARPATRRAAIAARRARRRGARRCCSWLFARRSASSTVGSTTAASSSSPS